MVRLMDCTLRDGANVVGKGFDEEITKIVLDILTESKVPIIEFGTAGGIGAYEVPPMPLRQRPALFSFVFPAF